MHHTSQALFTTSTQQCDTTALENLETIMNEDSHAIPLLVRGVCNLQKIKNRRQSSSTTNKQTNSGSHLKVLY